MDFGVPGPARGKARPRVTRAGAHTYTPDPGDYAARVRDYGMVARLEAGWEMTDEPVLLDIHVLRAMPTGWSRSRRESMDGSLALPRPDAVNIAAAICDALEGVFYVNDAQVVRLTIDKRWGQTSQTTITVDTTRGE